MREREKRENSRSRFVIMTAMLASAVVIVPLLSSRAQTTGTTIRVVNNSTREIHNLFLSPVNADLWGADQLDNVVIAANQTHSVSGVSCEGNQVKVIAEDQHGCFMTQVVTCGGGGGEGEAEWIVTNDTVADCGN